MDHMDPSPTRASLDGEPPAKRRRTSNTTSRPPREVGLMRSLPGDKFSSFIGSASGIYFIRSVYGAIRNSHSQSGAQIQTPESDIVPGEEDQLPYVGPDSSKALWKSHEATTQAWTPFVFDDLVRWSSSYFANWHPAYPFLHAPAVLQYFEQLSRNGSLPDQADQSPNAIILRSIMSMSLMDHRQASASPTTAYPAALVFSSYDAAMQSLHSILLRPASIESLRAAISVQLFLVSMLRLNAASRLGGLIIRMALQLGLHRCPNRYPSFSPADREARQRIMWSLYCLDRSVCQSMGLPLSLCDEDIDVCYPSDEQHLTEHRPTDSRLRLVEFLARHAEIRGQIMELRNKSIEYRQKEAELDLIITAKLARWWNDVEEFIDSDEIEPPTFSEYHQTVLTILYHESVISLNRPILAASNKGSAYNAALQYCIGSSRSIISTLYNAIKPKRGGGQETSPIPLLWHTCTWAVWMSTFILFYAVNEKHVPRSMVSRLADRSVEILQHLSNRGAVWPAACAAAIRDLRLQMLQNPPEMLHVNNNEQHSRPLGSTPDQNLPSQTPTTPLSNMRREQEGRNNASATHSLDWPPCKASTERTPRRTSSYSNQAGATAVVETGERGNAGLAHTSTLRTNSIQPVLREVPNSSFGYMPWNDHMDNNNLMDQSGPFGGGDASDPFAGFDIPFWIGQDQYSGMINEWT